jgi:hypothetical protein
MSYTKLFNKILASSIWNEDDKTRLVWITLLAMRNERNVVEGSVGGIAHQARVSLADCTRALEVLSSPDLDDSSKIDEGRRIRPLEHGGWLIVNGEVYKQAQNEDERRAKWAEYMRKYRKKHADRKESVIESKPALDSVSDVNTVEQSRVEQTEERVVARAHARVRERPKSVEAFIAGAAAIGIPEQDLRDQYELWSAADWHDGLGQPVFDWVRSLVSLKQQNLLPSNKRHLDSPVTGANGAQQQPSFRPDLEWVIQHFKQKRKGMNYMGVSRYCHEKLVARGFIWNRLPISDEEHARAVLSDISEQYWKTQT